MRKIKIIIFIYSLGGGGVQKFVMNLVKGINKEKFDINIALVNKKGVYLHELPEEVKLFDLKASKVHFSLFPLIKLLNKERPDILFCVDTNINIVGIVAELLSRSKPKLIIRQALELNRLSTSKRNMFLTKILYPKVDKCVVLTNDMKNRIKRKINLPDDKMRIIYNSLNIKEILIKKEEKIEDSFINIKNPKIITIGRLTRQKNHLMLIEAFKLVLNEKKAQLIIIGEGEDENKIKQKIKEEELEFNVHLIGYKNNPYKYIYNSDIFVLSSIYEGLSNALLEALACDIPIVTTDNPDSIIKNNINGLQAEISKEDIAEKLIQLLNDKSMCEAIVKNNKDYMYNFDITTMINEYENLFEEVSN